MKPYRCSYAYDVPCYRDFIVEANSKEEAEAKIRDALDAGRFDGVVGKPDKESASSERVFVMYEADPDDVESLESLKELTNQDHENTGDH